ncbi:hypothetical protein ACLOJK_026183 [Asimina triloba]
MARIIPRVFRKFYPRQRFRHGAVLDAQLPLPFPSSRLSREIPLLPKQQEQEKTPTRPSHPSLARQHPNTEKTHVRNRERTPPAPTPIRPHRHPLHRHTPRHLHPRSPSRPRGSHKKWHRIRRPPPATELTRFFNSNQDNISSASYGPHWRLLRRNLMSEILHPSRVKTFAEGRKWVLELLIKRLCSIEERGEPVRVQEIFQHVIFCLLLFMCFGEKLEESAVNEIERVQRRMLVTFSSFNLFAFLPRVGRLLFRKGWKRALELRDEREQLMIRLIRARRGRKEGHQDEKTKKSSFEFSYVDSLFALELAEEGGRKLTEAEIVTLCSEFMTGGTDTTSTAMDWIFANLVKNQDKQEKLVEDIERVVGKDGEIKEEDLQKMRYLKAVILEGLRRHPPGHLLLSHGVSEEVTLGGYVIPKNAVVNVTIAEIGLDKEVWEDPLEFRPERFLKEDDEEGVDITGSREIKMMPFGVGRRICPALSLAILHLEYLVANLVREFQWKPKEEGEIIDLSEKMEFTVVMKNPLEAKIISRRS